MFDYRGGQKCMSFGTTQPWDRRVELAYLGIVLPLGSISLDRCRPCF